MLKRDLIRAGALAGLGALSLPRAALAQAGRPGLVGAAETAEATRSPLWHPFTQHALGEEVPLIDRAEGAILHAADGRRFIDALRPIAAAHGATRVVDVRSEDRGCAIGLPPLAPSRAHVLRRRREHP